jgi:hypothetical protein
MKNEELRMGNDDFLWVMRQAIEVTDRPSAATLIDALLQAEKATKRDRTQFPQAALLGTWRLYFVTSGKVKLGDKRLRGFYLPKFLPATIGFASDETGELEITNQVNVGLVKLKLTGPARYESRKNLLPFDFTRLNVKVLEQSVYNGKFPSPREGQEFGKISIAKLPFFAFFQVSDRLIAARGRGGGLAMWIKD